MEGTRTSILHLWRDEESDILLWGLVLVALIVGLLVRGAAMSQTRPYNGPAVSLSYPARWADQTQTGQLLNVAANLGSSLAATTLDVQQQPFAKTGVGGAPNTLGQAVLGFTTQRGKDLTAYRVLNTTDGSLKGVPVSWVDYAYVQARGAGGAASLPVVLHAQSVLAQRGDQLIVITFTAPADSWDSMADQWQAIQNSIVFK